MSVYPIVSIDSYSKGLIISEYIPYYLLIFIVRDLLYLSVIHSIY